MESAQAFWLSTEASMYAQTSHFDSTTFIEGPLRTSKVSSPENLDMNKTRSLSP